jgi:hypothetical protein
MKPDARATFWLRVTVVVVTLIGLAHIWLRHLEARPSPLARSALPSVMTLIAGRGQGAPFGCYQGPRQSNPRRSPRVTAIEHGTVHRHVGLI